MMWEECVPLMRLGRHHELADLAYGPSGSGGRKVFPPRELVFQALQLTPFDDLRVVILGQDPYFNEHAAGPEAHGLCFSVPTGIPTPPSLRNILQEINASIYGGRPTRRETDLSDWARQGVLLLNASLTVVAGKANSHADLGWRELTDDIIRAISQGKERVVFMLWGAFAQKKAPLIDARKHCVLQTTHPSPLSAHRGFLGSGVFRRCNEYLLAHALPPIVW
ncbi:MAG: uracil-DNA glycosylase [Desulfobulbaceae bacterium]|jgi:uracil-DNA glycosylase|nr:uracil-DNA glycosylase [Desulfobulbaceae bacterium]